MIILWNEIENENKTYNKKASNEIQTIKWNNKQMKLKKWNEFFSLIKINSKFHFIANLLSQWIYWLALKIF